MKKKNNKNKKQQQKNEVDGKYRAREKTSKSTANEFIHCTSTLWLLIFPNILVFSFVRSCFFLLSLALLTICLFLPLSLFDSGTQGKSGKANQLSTVDKKEAATRRICVRLHSLANIVLCSQSKSESHGYRFSVLISALPPRCLQILDDMLCTQQKPKTLSRTIIANRFAMSLHICMKIGIHDSCARARWQTAKE